MPDYERNPTIPSVVNDLGRRVDAMERRTYGTLTYYNASDIGASTGTSLWLEEAFVVPDESVLEFAGYVEINHTASGATTIVSLYVDNVLVTDWARLSSAGTAGSRISSTPGDPYGAQGSTSPGGFIIGAQVNSASTGTAWGIDPGEHKIEVKVRSKTGAGASSIVDRAFAVRAS